MRAAELQRTVRSHKTSTGVGADGFHPKVPLDLGSGRPRARVIQEGKKQSEMGCH